MLSRDSSFSQEFPINQTKTADLDGIGANNFPIDPLGQLQSQPALSGSSRPRYHYNLLFLAGDGARSSKVPPPSSERSEKWLFCQSQAATAEPTAQSTRKHLSVIHFVQMSNYGEKERD